jgi:hypothetical protein
MDHLDFEAPTRGERICFSQNVSAAIELSLRMSVHGGDQRKTPREKFRRGVLSQFMLKLKISPRREG